MNENIKVIILLIVLITLSTIIISFLVYNNLEDNYDGIYTEQTIKSTELNNIKQDEPNYMTNNNSTGVDIPSNFTTLTFIVLVATIILPIVRLLWLR